MDQQNGGLSHILMLDFWFHGGNGYFTLTLRLCVWYEGVLSPPHGGSNFTLNGNHSNRFLFVSSKTTQGAVPCLGLLLYICRGKARPKGKQDEPAKEKRRVFELPVLQ
jgi:hypothetical protein